MTAISPKQEMAIKLAQKAERAGDNTANGPSWYESKDQARLFGR